MRLKNWWVVVIVGLGLYLGGPTLSHAKSVNEKILDILFAIPGYGH